MRELLAIFGCVLIPMFSILSVSALREVHNDLAERAESARRAADLVLSCKSVRNQKGSPEGTADMPLVVDPSRNSTDDSYPDLKDVIVDTTVQAIHVDVVDFGREFDVSRNQISTMEKSAESKLSTP